jgi:hypothetical protein
VERLTGLRDEVGTANWTRSVGTQPGVDAVRVENVVALGDQTQLFQRPIMSSKAKFLIEIRNPGKVREREREKQKVMGKGKQKVMEAILRKHPTFLSPTLLRKGNLSRFLFYKRIHTPFKLPPRTGLAKLKLESIGPV